MLVLEREMACIFLRNTCLIVCYFCISAHNATKYSLKQFLVIESLLNISNHFTLPLYDAYLRKTDFVAYNADI